MRLDHNCRVASEITEKGINQQMRGFILISENIKHFEMWALFWVANEIRVRKNRRGTGGGVFFVVRAMSTDRQRANEHEI
jgi:hypothetical protein